MRGNNMSFVTLLAIPCMACLLFCLSCQNQDKPDETWIEPLSDEQISSNLLTIGRIDHKHLIGKWDIVKFAYTADGKKISNVANIPKDEVFEWIKPELKIPDPPLTPPEWVEDISVLWQLNACNGSTLTCSLSGNLIHLKHYSGTKINCPNSVENDIVFALSNAYSFVIRGNELIVYFTGLEKLDITHKQQFKNLKNHNLVILRK